VYRLGRIHWGGMVWDVMRYVWLLKELCRQLFILIQFDKRETRRQ
jgi:hypothetical protein